MRSAEIDILKVLGNDAAMTFYVYKLSMYISEAIKN